MSEKFRRQCAASFELIFAASLWGFGFVATVWALPVWAPVPMIFVRFLLGAAAGLLFSFLVNRPGRDEFIWLLKASFLPAVFLFITLIFQTAGLRYTTATKSGFITILYVVLVPIFESVIWRKRLPLSMWFCVALALVGVDLIVDPSWSSEWNRGDLLTMACAVTAAFQILAIDKGSSKITKPFLYNSLQSLWCLILAAIVLPFQEGSVLSSRIPEKALIGILCLALGSTLIAFYLQVKAQKVLSPTVSSLFFLMESPFAMLFAFLLLHERLGWTQGIGAATIFISAGLATLRESKLKSA